MISTCYSSDLRQDPDASPAFYRELWDLDAQRWNDMWGTLLNTHRASLGQRAVDDVRSHIFTSRPWLAADPTLAP